MVLPNDAACDDGNPCTDDACDGSVGSGCANDVVADPASTPCDDGDADTTEDVCQADGSCLGLPFFCDGQSVAGCGFSALGPALDADGPTTYSGAVASCDATVAGNSTAQCLEPALPSSAEICVDFFDFTTETSAAGFAGVLADTSASVAPDQCVEGVPVPGCAPIAVPAGQHLLALQGADAAAQQAQIHIRCPEPTTSCDNGEQGHPELESCGEIASCTYPIEPETGGSQKFTSAINNYGSTCGSGVTGLEVRMEVKLNPEEARTLWLRAVDGNGTDITDLFTIYLSPNEGGQEKCKQHNNGSKKCFLSGPSPLHVPEGESGSYDEEDKYCAFLELDDSFTGDVTQIDLTLSLGCY